MKAFKKLIALVMACVLLVCCLTGCKSGSQDDEIPTLTWVAVGDDQPDLESVLAEVNKIAEEKIGARVDIEFVDTASYGEKVKMFMASGKDYDIYFTGFLNDYHKAALNGGLYDITDLLDEYAPDLTDSVPQYALEAAKVNGRIYGVPNHQMICNPHIIFTFKALAEKYNFDFEAVKHVDEIEPYLEKIKTGEPEMYPYKPDISHWYRPVYEFVMDNTNCVVKKDGSSPEVSLVYETDEFKQGLKKIREWYQKGYIRADVASAGDDTTDLRNCKYGVAGVTWGYGSDRIAIEEYGQECVYAFTDQPYVQRHSSLLAMLSVGANSKHPEKAVQLINLLDTDKDFYNLVCNGIMGKHYNLTEDNKVQFVENSGYAPKTDIFFGNRMNAYLWEGMEDDTVEMWEKYNNEATKSPLLGFVPDTTKITGEISQITTVNSKYAAMLTGSLDIDEYYDKYVAELEAAGQKKVQEEFQRQVNEFFANKK